MTMDVDEIPIVTEVDHDGDGEDGTVYVHVGIINADGEQCSGSATAPMEITADEVARLIVRAALGAAAAHSTDTWIALQQLLASEPRSSGP
ncbi:hypothetical protein Lesp02_84190 [Lentzea sp. NBRC 105346]|uniref:hypothetical protein n=1 Tax=Lentzea sp. NBRC 105346 TaxID=3032205 RepID=UPI0024A2FD44|nr:hypothetical protein [Lentzea sp. NBRC 105346]GLZ36232.1 hypothetical protein Lesp02_84190 [Lentzea sp. NBRC 105346]